VNAGWLWIALPMLAAVGLSLWPRVPTRRKRWGAVAIAALLSLIAWKVPIGEPLPLLGYRWTWTLAPEWRLLGRTFELSEKARPWLMALYAWAGLWALFSAEARLAPDFPAWSLALPATLTLALAAQDFLYTVLLLGLAYLSLTFLWTTTSRPIRGAGVMRFLTFAVLGLPLLLLALARLPGLETAPPDTPGVVHGGLLLGLGLALWAGVFPFHTAYPLLGQEGHPYRLSFGWWLTHFALVLAVLHWAPQFVWLRDNPHLTAGLKGLGLGTLALAGLLVLFPRDLGRVAGYVAWLSTGWSWLALAHGLEHGPTAFLALAWPRALLWLGWTWALAVLGLPHDRFTVAHLRGRGKAAPWTAALAILGLGAWAPWPGLGLAGLNANILQPLALTSGEWVAVAVAFAGITWAAKRWLERFFLNAGEPQPNLPETWRERVSAGFWLLLWVMVAFTPGLWYAWAEAAAGWVR